MVFEGAEAEDYESGPMEYVSYHGDHFDRDSIDFFVAGEPVPQGSTKAFYIKKLERVVTTHTNANTEKWRNRIATEAQRANELRPRTSSPTTAAWVTRWSWTSFSPGRRASRRSGR